MTRDQARVRIAELTALLRHNSKLYYTIGMPEISDYEYDMKMRELEAIEEEYPELQSSDSPTQVVGCSVADMEEMRPTE